jgi:hypothetical protein
VGIGFFIGQIGAYDFYTRFKVFIRSSACFIRKISFLYEKEQLLYEWGFFQRDSRVLTEKTTFIRE